MYKKDRLEYVIKTCSAQNPQELQNLLNEMSMNGWELYTMTEIEEEDSTQMTCIFMREAKSENSADFDIINISDFKSQMEKMLSPKMNEFEQCLDIQSKIKLQKAKVNKIKSEIEKEAPASALRKKLNDKISAGIKELEDLKVQLSKATSPDLMYSKLHEDRLSIYLSEELLSFVDGEGNDDGEELIAQTVKSRLNLTNKLGYVIPKVVFKDDETLNPCEFSIKIRGYEVFKSVVCPDCKIYFADELHTEHKIKNSQNTVDEITGRKAIWVPKDLTKDFWQVGLTSSEYIAKALEYVCVKYADDLMDYEDIDKYLDVVEKENEYLVDMLVPEAMSYADIKYILTSLIKEHVSVKNITYIFEKINDFVQDGSMADILSKIRLSLAKQIVRPYVNSDEESISVLELSEKTYSDLFLTYDENNEEGLIKLDAALAEKMVKKIARLVKKLDIKEPKIVVPMEYRQMLFSVLSQYLKNITVLAQEEVGCLYKIDVLGAI